jgi:hypothetical protein
MTTLPLERHARLWVRGAPERLAFLNGPWRRDLKEPVIGDRPHYVQPGSVRHIFYHAGVHEWHVASIQGSEEVVHFSAASPHAYHPNTVPRSAWRLVKRGDSDNSGSSVHAIEISCTGPNTPEQPYLLEEIGIDYFLQPMRREITWFEVAGGRVFHSGTKPLGEAAVMGKRYCPVCRKCISSQNYRSKHLSLHLPGTPSGVVCAPEGDGHVRLTWDMPPRKPFELVPTHLHLRVSVDGGAVWKDVEDPDDIEDTWYDTADGHTQRLSTRIAASAPMPHIFVVAAVNAVGRGRWSEPSRPAERVVDILPAVCGGAIENGIDPEQGGEHDSDGDWELLADVLPERL